MVKIGIKLDLSKESQTLNRLSELTQERKNWRGIVKRVRSCSGGARICPMRGLGSSTRGLINSNRIEGIFLSIITQFSVGNSPTDTIFFPDEGAIVPCPPLAPPLRQAALTASFGFCHLYLSSQAYLENLVGNMLF